MNVSASTSLLPESEPDQEIRGIFDSNLLVGQNAETSAIDISKFLLLTDGCSCERKCIEKFPADELLHAHFNTSDLNYYCGNHVNHLNLFIQGEPEKNNVLYAHNYFETSAY